MTDGFTGPNEFIHAPKQLKENLSALKAGCGLVFSARANEKRIGVILARVTSDDITYYGISPKRHRYNRNLRYLDVGSNEMVQIQVRAKRRRVLNLNLDPFAWSTRLGRENE